MDIQKNISTLQKVKFINRIKNGYNITYAYVIMWKDIKKYLTNEYLNKIELNIPDDVIIYARYKPNHKALLRTADLYCSSLVNFIINKNEVRLSMFIDKNNNIAAPGNINTKEQIINIKPITITSQHLLKCDDYNIITLWWNGQNINPEIFTSTINKHPKAKIKIGRIISNTIEKSYYFTTSHY